MPGRADGRELTRAEQKTRPIAARCSNRPYDTTMADAALPDAVLDFWFGPPPHAARDVWFRKDAAFRRGDPRALRRGRRGGPVRAAGRGHAAQRARRRHPPRPVHAEHLRDTPRAFRRRRQRARHRDAVVAAGRDRELDAFERWFLYLPFEHSESPAMQERFARAVRRAGAGDRARGTAGVAEKHAAVVRRFRPLPAPQCHPRAASPRRRRSRSWPSRARGSEHRGVADAATMPSAMTAPLGILGGTFDPIHLATSSSAREVRRRARARRGAPDPGRRPAPSRRPVATAAHRLAMVQLAVEGCEGLEVDDREIEARGSQLHGAHARGTPRRGARAPAGR